jgi:hypothetical protein
MKGPVRDPATYAFNAAARTITFTAPIPAFQGYILGITNVTRGVFVYLPIDPELVGTYNAGTGVLTLAFDTTGQANGDTLQVFCDDTTSSASSALQTVGNASLASIDADLGSPTDAPAATPTATAGIGGLIRLGLQNAATALTNWTTLLGRTPTLVGGRVPVDGSAVTQPVSVSVRNPVTTSIASSVNSTTILASNANRRGLFIYNDSTAVLRVSFSTPATSGNSFVGIPARSFLILDPLLISTATLYGIWETANGTAQITEWS